MTGRDTYRVRHRGDSIGRIYTSGGYPVLRNSELFTEVAEAFHIDRRWEMMEDADVQGFARQWYA